MPIFRVDEESVHDTLRRARARAKEDGFARLLAQAHADGGLQPEDLAALWVSNLDTDVLYAAACQARAACPAPLETFSPLYMTNTCDAECRMCGMRRDNDALTRETADITEVEGQLRLLSRRGMHAVALLTGEYRAATRPWALDYVNHALRLTQALGFAHVLINVGSIDKHEFEALLAGI